MLMSAAEVNIEALREVYPKACFGCFMKKPFGIKCLVEGLLAELDWFQINNGVGEIYSMCINYDFKRCCLTCPRSWGSVYVKSAATSEVLLL